MPRGASTWRIRAWVDRDRRLLALELVDRTHACAGQCLLDLEDLGVVRRDDQDALQTHVALLSIPVNPGRAAFECSRHEIVDGPGLLRRAVPIAGMLDRQEAQARAAEGAGPFDDLLFEVFPGAQLAGVEELRGEGADPGMEPPGLFQEQALVGPDGLGPAEDVVERRDIRPFRVGALHRLVKLPRISDQDQQGGCVRDGQHVGQ